MPVFKKDNDTDKICYQPVSILTALSKVYESFLFDQMYQEFGTKVLSCLSGYLKVYSCCMAFLKMSKDWRTYLDIREAVSTIAVDLSKAFDSVCYGHLLAKLKAWGFSGDTLVTISAYLQGRRDCTIGKNRWSLFRMENCEIRHPTGISLGTTAVQKPE